MCDAFWAQNCTCECLIAWIQIEQRNFGEKTLLSRTAAQKPNWQVCGLLSFFFSLVEKVVRPTIHILNCVAYKLAMKTYADAVNWCSKFWHIASVAAREPLNYLLLFAPIAKNNNTADLLGGCIFFFSVFSIG